MNVFARDAASGAKVGLVVGIAVAGGLVVLVSVFIIIHLRRRTPDANLDHEQPTIVDEKIHHNPDQAVKMTPELLTSSMPGIPRRNKSVRDRLMGPLYRESSTDLATPLPRVRAPGTSHRQSAMTLSDSESMINRPWVENSPRPSFSSRRATRIMMMM